MDLDRGVGDATQQLGGEELRHRRPVGHALPAVGARGRVVHHETRRVDLGGGVRDGPLDRLVHADGLAELRAGLRVGDARFEEPLRGAHRVGRESHAAVVERAQRDLEALPLLADPLRRGHAQLAEEELRGRRPVQTHLRVVRSNLETMHVPLDDERGDALRSESAVHRGEDHEHVGDRRVRDEGLGAVDDVAIAVATRGGLQTGRVAPRARLGETVRADLPRGEEIRQITAAEGIRPADVDRRPAEAGRAADDVPERGVRAGKLLHGDAVPELAEPLTAAILREAEPEEAHLGHVVDRGTRDRVAFLDLARERLEPCLDELADRALQHEQLVGKDGVHDA